MRLRWFCGDVRRSDAIEHQFQPSRAVCDARPDLDADKSRDRHAVIQPYDATNLASDRDTDACGKRYPFACT